MILSCCYFVLFFSCQGQTPAPSSTSVIQLSNHPQLFLDDYLIAKKQNLKRVLQRPTKHPSNPLIIQDRPWERRYMQMYGTVLYDEETNRFRAWYMASEDDQKTPNTYICYAESQDGIKWIKPSVGRIELQGHPSHNAVLAGGHGLCVFKDTNESDPSKRYKGLGGEILAFSPDGIQWATEPFPSAGENDTSSCVVQWKGEYLAYIRNQESWKGSVQDNFRAYLCEKPFLKQTIREAAFSASPDYQHWTPKETILKTDLQDGYPWAQPYGMAVTPYGDILIGVVWFLRLDPIKNNEKIGVFDTQLAVSRDGRRWNRVANRETFLSPSDDAWDKGRIYPSTTMIVKDDLIYIYYTGSDTRHGEGWGQTSIGLATLPKDRFAAMRPDSFNFEGVLQTKPLLLSGAELTINAEIGEGNIEVELLDTKERPLPGFERSHSRLEKNGVLRYNVQWVTGNQSKSIQDAPARNPIAIRFFLQKASLFAFQITAGSNDQPNIEPITDNPKYRTPYEIQNASFCEAIASDPENHNLYIERAELHAQAGNLTLALKDYKKALRLNNQNAAAYRNYGKILFLKGEDPADTIAAFEKAHQLDPDNEQILCDLGLIYFGAQRDQKAIDTFTQAIQLDPMESYAYGGRGIVYYYLRKNYDAALEDFNRAIQLNADEFLFYYMRGKTSLNLKKYLPAIADFTRAIELDPNEACAYKMRGYTYNLQQVEDQTDADLSKAIQLNPVFTSYYLDRGLSYIRTNQFQRAIPDFSKYITYFPKQTVGYRNRGLAYFSIQEYNHAIEDLTQAIEYGGKHIHYLLARAYALRALASQNEEQSRLDKEQALSSLELAVENGFNQWDRLKQDPCFPQFYDDPRFQAIIAGH